MNECQHGEPRGSRYCALCRAAGVSGEGHTDSPAPYLGNVLDWERAAKHTIWELARSGRPFTSEDITAEIGFPDQFNQPNGKNNRIGTLLNQVAKSYGMRRVDMQPARNPQSHGRLLTVWQGRPR